MPIVAQGNINTTALVVPDLYVQIVPPQNLVLNGVPTNVVGAVGTATWGPVGTPIIFGNAAQYATAFGPIMPRKYDMGTQVATAVQQGAQSFVGVRATDGTDAKATSAGVATCITYAALYTGTLGDTIQVSRVTGSKVGTFKVIVSVPGYPAEQFDNIAGTGNAYWLAEAAAINSGVGFQGPSKWITATALAGTTPPSLTAGTPYTFASGSDGVATMTASVLIGVDGVARTGMYALRSKGCSIGVLADADDATQWTNQVGFGLSEGVYMILTGPAGDTIANAVSSKATAGIDSYAAKMMFGDWLWWQDNVNQTIRLVSPQGFVAGRLSNLAPNQSSLNKPLYGVIGSQRAGAPGTQQAQTYSSADLSALFSAGIDVICNPQPGGAFWGARSGHNASSQANINGDNYTRMTNYIAATLASGMGVYVGLPVTADLLRNIRATQLSFMQNLLNQKLLGTVDGSIPFSVICDASNNPPSRTGLGYVQSDAQVQFQAINEKFIVNVEGGQTVQVARQITPPPQ